MRKSFKAFLSGLLAVIMLVTAIPFAVFAETRTEAPHGSVKGQTLLGDADQDGTIGIADAIMIARHALGLSSVISTCDINRDGVITIADSILAARCAMMLIEWMYDIEISYTRPADGHTLLDEETNTYYVDNQMLVVGRDGVAKEQIAELVSEYNGVIVGYIELTDDFQIQFSQEYPLAVLETIAEQLKTSELVDEAMIHQMTPTDLSDAPTNDSEWVNEEWSETIPYGKNWGVEALECVRAWNCYNSVPNETVNVGIIDSMFDTNHEDLNFVKVWNNPSNISSEKDYFERSHGTHVTGTFAATFNNEKGITGVAPRTNIYGYSMHGSTTDPIVEANRLTGTFEWKYAIANLVTANCRVINVSMGKGEGYKDGEITDFNLDWEAWLLGVFLSKLLSYGYDFVIVQAAGNENQNARNSGLFTRIDFPEVQDRIIVVAAIKNNGRHRAGLLGGFWGEGVFGDYVFDGYQFAWWFSNWGDRVDVVAPGVKIYSSVPGNKYEDHHYLESWDGTSMAAPHISGIAAMCFSVNANISGKQVKELISNVSTGSDTSNPVFPTVSVRKKGRTYNYPLPSAFRCVNIAAFLEGENMQPVYAQTGTIMGHIYRYTDNPSEIAGVAISAYEKQGSSIVLAGSTVSSDDGEFILALKTGNYSLNIFLDGFLPYAIDSVDVIEGQTTFVDTIFLIPDEYENQSYQINGSVTNALTGENLSGVNIKLRLGWNNTSGDLALDASGSPAKTTSNSSGQYSIEMPAMCYTAEFSKEGYITTYSNVISAPNTGLWNTSLSPILASGEYRIVLTWGADPRDLDSHVEGTLTNGNSFHVYYSDKTQNDGSITVCELDHDDIDGYGPETITLRPIDTCSYYYYIKRFNGSGSISTSGAQVKIYSGSTLLWTFNAPTNQGTGDYWNVLALVNGRPVIKNTITDSPDTGYQN